VQIFDCLFFHFPPMEEDFRPDRKRPRLSTEPAAHDGRPSTGAKSAVVRWRASSLLRSTNCRRKFRRVIFNFVRSSGDLRTVAACRHVCRDWRENRVAEVPEVTLRMPFAYDSWASKEYKAAMCRGRNVWPRRWPFFRPRGKS